jgi:hypothetical protein
LGQAGHGSWYFSLDLPRHVDGGRRRLWRGGYLTGDAAEAARDRLRVPPPGDPGGHFRFFREFCDRLLRVIAVGRKFRIGHDGGAWAT